MSPNNGSGRIKAEVPTLDRSAKFESDSGGLASPPWPLYPFWGSPGGYPMAEGRVQPWITRQFIAGPHMSIFLASAPCSRVPRQRAAHLLPEHLRFSAQFPTGWTTTNSGGLILQVWTRTRNKDELEKAKGDWRGQRRELTGMTPLINATWGLLSGETRQLDSEFETHHQRNGDKTR